MEKQPIRKMTSPAHNILWSVHNELCQQIPAAQQESFADHFEELIDDCSNAEAVWKHWLQWLWEDLEVSLPNERWKKHARVFQQVWQVVDAESSAKRNTWMPLIEHLFHSANSLPKNDHWLQLIPIGLALYSNQNRPTGAVLLTWNRCVASLQIAARNRQLSETHLPELLQHLAKKQADQLIRLLLFFREPRHEQEASLQAAALSGDPYAALVYADWLEERASIGPGFLRSGL